MDEERHEMHRVKQFKTGAEEWECRECGRRFMIRFVPNFQKMILEPGNENAVHFGGSPGITLGITQADQKADDLDATSLQTMKRWSEIIDFEGIWNRN